MRVFLLMSMVILAFSICTDQVKAAGKSHSRYAKSAIEETEVPEQTIQQEFELLCPICTEKEVDTLFLPCNHVTACQGCAQKMDHCPQCREEIKSKVSPVFFKFSPSQEESTEGEDSHDFEAMCTTCKTHPVDTLFSPCKHITSCHECASQIKVCPECSQKVKDKKFPVFVSYLPEIKEGGEEESRDLQEVHSQGVIDFEHETKMRNFIGRVRSTANLLSELDSYSNSNNSVVRSGSELVTRVHVAAILSLGVEVCVGKYTTTGFRGVPYVRLGFVVGYGLPGAVVSCSSRKYSKASPTPSPDFSVLSDQEALFSGAIGIGATEHKISRRSRSSQSMALIEENGVAVGFWGAYGRKGITLARVPVFIPTQYLSKKGRLLIRAKNLEKKMIKLIKKKKWKRLFDQVMPVYLDTVDQLDQRVREKNRFYPNPRALAEDHPFYSFENLLAATQK
jgi:hypothetical protein